MDVAVATGAHSAAAGARYTALVGFCFGGGKVVDVLASVAVADATQSTAPAVCSAGPNFTSGVAFYGTRVNREALADVRTPLALYFASEDPLVPLTDVKDFEKVLEARVEHSAADTTSKGSSSPQPRANSAIFSAASVMRYTSYQHAFVS